MCAAETALIASMEGTGHVPSQPLSLSLRFWGKPTNINNVETYANVPWIINHGGAAFASMGTADSKGTKVFALAGKVNRGRLVEVPMGISLREIIYDIGGGIKTANALKPCSRAARPGCIPEAYLDTPVDYQSITCLGAIMGSGGMIVVDEDTCMVDMARYFLDFTKSPAANACSAGLAPGVCWTLSSGSAMVKAGRKISTTWKNWPMR